MFRNLSRMDTTVAKSAKSKSAPARPKAAQKTKASTSSASKAKKTAAAKRPKATAAASKTKSKPAPARKVVAKQPVKTAATRTGVKAGLKASVAPSKKSAVSRVAKPVKRSAAPVAPVKRPPMPPPPPPQLDKAAKKAALERQKILQAQEKANQAALKAFEQALRSFHRQEYGPACEAFKKILEEFGNDVEVAPRARDYANVCEQRMEKPKTPPKSSEAYYSQGVYELNAGRYEKAANLLERATKMEPNSAYIIYSLAAAQAQLDDVDTALETLHKAIQLEESLKNRARRDSDFVNLINIEEFRELVGIESEPPLVL